MSLSADQIHARVLIPDLLHSLPQARPVLDYLARHGADWIMLAGFLSLVPPAIVDAYPRRIVNIHPALLPSFGGKGMYGMRVHRAVIASGASESGITVHYVNDRYDEGEIIFQAKVKLDPGETAGSLREKIRTLELEHYPRVIERLAADAGVPAPGHRVTRRGTFPRPRAWCGESQSRPPAPRWGRAASCRDRVRSPDSPDGHSGRPR